MLFQGNMFAPIYCYTSKIGSRSGKSGSLVEWKRSHHVMVEANIHLRLLHTSILHIYKVFESLLCCLKAIWVHLHTVTPAKMAPDLGKCQGHLGSEKWCHNIMVEADIHLRLLHTSILDIYKVFEPLLWCFKEKWLHPDTVTPSKLAPDLGSQGSLVEWKWCHHIMVVASSQWKISGEDNVTHGACIL